MTAIITISENKSAIVETNGLDYYLIINVLSALKAKLAQDVYNEAVEICGNDMAKVEAYMDKRSLDSVTSRPAILKINGN